MKTKDAKKETKKPKKNTSKGVKLMNKVLGGSRSIHGI